MAKKKSKTQKYKKNVKKKAKKILAQTTELNLKVSPKVKVKDKIIEKEVEIPKTKKEVSLSPNKINKKKSPKKVLPKLSNKKKEKEEKVVLPKLKSNKKASKDSKNTLINRLIYELRVNSHIIFNAILIIAFIIMIVGFFKTEALSIGKIIYISSISLFLIAVAISYNKYLSGKVFTIALCIIMFFIIYKLQYTYDFVRNLNFNAYEYKTYYVVTFDSPQNRNVYNLNNKKIGLLKDNCINIERRLNTKLDKVKYIEYDNINQLFYDFYSQEFRAILVNENQYKYLESNIENNRDVKILYEFKANAKK